MSDPVEHAGVEDVLSSIRRLVSEDSRAPREGAPVRQVPAPRLVLTPALRVMGGGSKDGDSSAGPRPISAKNGSAESVAQSPADAVLALKDVLLGGDGADAKALMADDGADVGKADQTGPDHFDLRSPKGSDEAATSQSAADFAEAVPEAKPSHVPTPPWADPSVTLYQAATTDPATDAEDNPARTDNTPVSLHAHVRGKRRASERAAAVVQKIAEMEAAQSSGRAEDWEPDASSGAPFAAAAYGIENAGRAPLSVDNGDGGLTFEDMLEADIAEDVLGQLPAAEDTAVIDEDALRDMVVDIVRSELQGALGERITRNVRKLVRREIQRALAAHDLT